MKSTMNMLEQLIRIETVASNPIALQQGIVFINKLLQSQGIITQLNKHHKFPYLVWGASLHETKILINTHMDVVPGQPAQFVPRCTAKRVYGRGAADTKGFLAVLLHLPVNCFLRAKEKGITFMVVTDEEIGGDTTKEVIKSMPKLAFGIFGEPTNLRIVNQAKGIAQIRVTATGTTSHGSTPWQGVNAISQLTHQLATFMQSNPTSTKETFETTYTPTLIEGGRAINQLPEGARLTFDVRFNPDDSMDVILHRLTQHFGENTVEVLRHETAINTSVTLPQVRQFTKHVRTCIGTVKFDKQHASSDARHLSALGIPALVFGPIGDDLHGDAEWVSLESLEIVSNILQRYIQSM
jgi:succinyl-diaminopimelate desuccinylase